jgi:uncharacterized protein YjiS (DUF1127 family)
MRRLACPPACPPACPSIWRRLRSTFADWQPGGRRHDLAALDNAALRDLGLDRSELDSCLAESLGRAENTRVRIACPAWARAGIVVAMAAMAAMAGGCMVHDEPVILGALPSPAALPAQPRIDESYFPRQFPDPQGEIEPLPNQF